MRQQLAGPLGRTVERYRPVGARVFAEGRLCVVAIDRSSTRHRRDAAGRRDGARIPECVGMANQIGMGIGGRVGDGIAHARLGSEMQDNVVAFPVRSGVERAGRGNVRLDESGIAPACRSRRDGRVSRPDRSRRCDLINGRDGMTTCQQRQRRMEADEPGTACEENTHRQISAFKPLPRWTVA